MARPPGSRWRTGRTTGHPAGCPRRWRSATDGRADDTEYRSPCGAGELAVWTDANERRGSWESRGSCEPYAPAHEHMQRHHVLYGFAWNWSSRSTTRTPSPKAALRRIAEDAEMPGRRAGARRGRCDGRHRGGPRLPRRPVRPGRRGARGRTGQQASWSSERIDYDPDSPEWDLDEDDDDEDDEATRKTARRLSGWGEFVTPGGNRRPGFRRLRGAVTDTVHRAPESTVDPMRANVVCPTIRRMWNGTNRS